MNLANPLPIKICRRLQMRDQVLRLYLLYIAVFERVQVEGPVNFYDYSTFPR